MAGQTIFERYGGFSRVRRIVSTFYENVLDCPQVQHHFADVDMRALIDHQTKFISSIMGGPASISDDQLRRAHLRLGITRSEFDRVVEILIDALDEHNVEESDITHIRREVLRREPFIVTRQD